MNFVCLGLATSCLISSVLGGLVPPYIRSRCSDSVGEPNDYGWCLDPQGREEPFAWDDIHAHSCKFKELDPWYADQMWAFGHNGNNLGCDSSIGQIYGGSDTINGICLAGTCDDESCELMGVDCTDTESLTVWKYDQESGNLQVYGSLEKAVSSSSSDSDDTDCDGSSSSSSSSSSDSDSEDDDGYDLCIRVGTDIWDSMGPGYKITYAYLQSCDEVGIYGQWDIIGADDEDDGPQC